MGNNLVVRLDVFRVGMLCFRYLFELGVVFFSGRKKFINVGVVCGLCVCGMLGK